ncbi:hypothetical protein [Nocardioides alcanivorans]|uniref:hypothetical protein n=1 Tax=Nocardioides alcanivorans TaxID=2897352 RepID=UPI001F3B08B5|nr:hypothetical protein [Nocardioides alcanivorans]
MPSALPDDLATRAACAALVLPAHVVVADRSAAWLHGVDCLRYFETEAPPPLEVVSAAGSPTRRKEMYGGERDLRPDEITVVNGVPVTTPLRTAIDLACLRGPALALAALEAIMRECSLVRVDLERQLRRHRGRRGVIQARRLVEIASSRVESPGESMTKWYLVEAGLPLPEPQWRLQVDGWGEVRLDLSYPLLKIAVEYDGKEFHRDPERKEHDRLRREALRREGWIVIVVEKEDLAAGAREQWIAEVRAAVAERAPEFRRTFPRSVTERGPRRRN